MKRIITKDGSVTFYNEQIGDVYHSTFGAVEEAFGKYAEPTGIPEMAKKGKVRLLDICFGLGYNACAAIDAAIKANKECMIELIGLESDRDILGEIGALTPPFKHYEIIKSLIGSKDLSYQDKNVKIRLVMGDARQTLKEIEPFFDAVFLDPFSPKKQPELWQEGFFRDIRLRMNKGAKLTTYSCARWVRENFKKAGFKVLDGPKVGRPSPSTVAVNP